MSLARDYEMYYSGTYIVVNRNGVKMPFLVNRVRFSNYADQWEILSEDGERYIRNPDFQENLSSDYSESAYDLLEFEGNLFTSQESGGRRQTFNFRDAELSFDIPELGYYCNNGVLHWTTIAPSRSVKKGLATRRLTVPPMRHQDVFNIFNPDVHGRALGRISEDFAIVRNCIEYKGMYIGTVQNNTVTLIPDARYLQTILQRKLEQNVIVEEENDNDSADF